MNGDHVGGEGHDQFDGGSPSNPDGGSPSNPDGGSHGDFDYDPADVRLADETLFDSAAFERFDLWMDGSLKLLVARYAPLAAPRASRPFFGRIHGGRMRKAKGTS